MTEITLRMGASTHQLTVVEDGKVTKDIDVSNLDRQQRRALARNMALWQEMKG